MATRVTALLAVADPSTTGGILVVLITYLSSAGAVELLLGWDDPTETIPRVITDVEINALLDTHLDDRHGCLDSPTE